MNLKPVAEAQGQLLALRPPLPAETLPLDACVGRWLAGDLNALRDQPWTDLSAMDGYAVRDDDREGPWQVVGESAAGGMTPPPLAPGQAMRIFTGAPMPKGPGAVLIQENATREEALLTLTPGEILPAGANIRRRASDFQEGQALIPAATQLHAAQLALAAIAGHATLPVGRRPTVAILSTGSELSEPGAARAEGQMPASNAVMLRAMLSALPCTVTDLGIVPDSLPPLLERLSAAAQHDVIVTTGGASVGDHDLVQQALREAGGTLAFWKVRMRPGKPMIVGELGNALFLGLPGNPVSAFVTAQLFLLPMVRHLAGSALPFPATRALPLGAPMPAGESRDEYHRAIIAQGIATPITNRDSAGLLSLSRANALIHRPALCPPAHIGDDVEVLPL